MNTPPRQYCGQADLTVRSIVDGDIFKVSRECLARESEVFRERSVIFIIHKYTE